MTEQPPGETDRPASRTDTRALDHVEEITARLGSEPTVFLDYDGTLTAIVGDPSQATITDAERTVLRELAGHAPVAIVSGRGLDDVKGLVAITGLIYAGSHGFEIELPDGETFEHEQAERFAADLAQAAERLTAGAGDLSGVFIERKPYAIAVHTRRAESDEVRVRAGDLAERVADEFDSLTVTGGKEIHEIRPALDWDKGRAVDHVLGRLPGSPTPLYIGDDETDEDAFRMVEQLGGVGILVAPVGAAIETAAHYVLADPAETIEFLARLTVSLD